MPKNRKTYEDYSNAIKERFSNVKHKLIILSCKGGVGKSTIVANLACSFAMRGYRVGVFDADLHGPCIPKMLEADASRPSVLPDNTIIPPEGVLSIRTMSMAYLLPDESSPLVWRGPLKAKFLMEVLSLTEWGDLDFFLVDCPPGTGDEPLSVMQLIPDIDGAIVVTTPQEVSASVARKAAIMVQKLGVPLLGIIENMSYFKCPNCGYVAQVFGEGGGEAIARELGTLLLARIPLVPEIGEEAPYVYRRPESEVAQLFFKIVDKIAELVKRKDVPSPPPTGEASQA